jgi:hypothetical protein
VLINLSERQESVDQDEFPVQDDNAKLASGRGREDDSDAIPSNRLEAILLNPFWGVRWSICGWTCARRTTRLYIKPGCHTCRGITETGRLL